MPADDLYDPAQSPHSDMDSDDDLDRPGPSRRGRGKGGAAGASNGKDDKGGGGSNGKGKDNMNAWEATYKRSWDVVQEDESGGLQAAVESLIARGRRKR
jgi:transcription initiation factor TFIIH subunit 2